MVKFNQTAMPNCVKEGRAGRFYIKKRFIDDHPHIVLGIMARVIVVRCELEFISDSIRYEAYSPEFLPMGDDYGHICIPNEYDIIVHASGSNLMEFTLEFKCLKENEKGIIAAIPLRTITYGDSNENADFAHDPIMFNNRLR